MRRVLVSVGLAAVLAAGAAAAGQSPEPTAGNPFQTISPSPQPLVTEGGTPQPMTTPDTSIDLPEGEPVDDAGGMSWGWAGLFGIAGVAGVIGAAGGRRHTR